MHALTGWFIRNPVAANLLMALILITGIVTLSAIRIEGFPKVPPDTVSITTTFANAYTHQIDEQVTQKIEDALEGLNGVKKIMSTSSQGVSEITVQKNEGYSLQRLLDDVRIRIDGIGTLPEDADRPVITRNEFDFPALYVLVSGDTDQKALQKTAKDLKETLLAKPEISRLRLLGEKTPEIQIDIAPQMLEKYGLTMQDVAAKISTVSLMYESGTLKTKGGNISLRADSQAYYKRDFAAIPIIDNLDGTRITLGDIAQIYDNYHDDDVILHFNGEEAVAMEVLIAQTENLLLIADVVKQTMEDFGAQLSPEISLSIFGDTSVYISDRLELLHENALQGLLLVVFLLALFLNARLAFWVGMGIPISLAGAIAMMGTKWIDYSLNDITTFGMIIALGILVDDAVVVGESVFEERRKTNDTNPLKGTEKGVARVATATIFGVLTTVAAFFPMMLIENALGKVLAAFSGVVILALLFSLLESKLILPSHLAHISIKEDDNPRFILSRAWKACQNVAQNGLNRFKTKIYAPVLHASIHNRYAVLILFIAVAALGMGLLAKGKIKTVFFPEIPGQYIMISIEMDARAPWQMNVDNAEKIEKSARALNDYYIEQGITKTPPLHHVLKYVAGTHNTEIYAELTPSEERPNLETAEVMRAWQKRVGALEGAIAVDYAATEALAGDFSFQLFSKNEDELRAASAEFVSYLSAINGVNNLRDGMKGGRPELRLELKPEAQHLGFTAQDLAAQIAGHFATYEVQRLQRERKEVKVVLQNSHDNRSSLEDLMQTRLKNSEGKWFPLSAIANIQSLYSSEFIERRDDKRVNSISANIDKSLVSPSEVSQDIFENLVPKLKQKYSSVEFKQSGEMEEMTAIQGGLVRAFILTCILIYVLMAVPLKSYVQPFIIMSVVPFGFIGAVLGHLIMDMPLSLLSFFGMLALTGVVVNDSLVMMTRYNQEREEGHSILDALNGAGIGRFQPIFLTTATTVVGLTPLMMEESEQAQYLIPAAVSLAFGEIFATMITLILVPVLIHILEDIKNIKILIMRTS